MFDWLFGKKPPPEPPAVDRVWIDVPALDRALVRELDARPAVVVAFFDDTLRRVERALGAGGHVEGERLALMRADRLERVPAGLPVLVAERHPLPSANRALLERLQAAAPGVVPVFYSALDDALLRRFSGDRTATLMRQLGLQPDEPVEHPLVAKALANAREKVAAKAGPTAELDTGVASAEAWLDRHVGPAAA